VRRSEILVGLDLGSSRIKAVVADVRDRELPEILGTGEADSQGRPSRLPSRAPTSRSAASPSRSTASTSRGSTAAA